VGRGIWLGKTEWKPTPIRRRFQQPQQNAIGTSVEGGAEAVITFRVVGSVRPYSSLHRLSRASLPGCPRSIPRSAGFR
jgi:hypothetical protein